MYNNYYKGDNMCRLSKQNLIFLKKILKFIQNNKKYNYYLKNGLSEVESLELTFPSLHHENDEEIINYKKLLFNEKIKKY